MLNKSILRKGKSQNIAVFNSILWICCFVVLLFLFSGRNTPEKIDYIYTICFVVTLFIPVSFNLYYLVPRFLKKEKNIFFMFFFILNLIVFAELNPLFFDWIVNMFFGDYYFISYHNKLEIYFIFFIVFIISTLSKLAEDWVYLNKVENKKLKVQKQEVEQQLYYLKGQINPHFLFNSLNVLYSLAIDKKEEITNAILQLSDILRYVIYGVETNKVMLKKELALINNYINFEKNKQIKNSEIIFNHQVNEALEIYPMLLLPIVENSFKHGLKSGVKNPFVKIDLSEHKGKLTLIVSNNFKEHNLLKKNNIKGIGLKNIQENLSLIYPKKHELKKDIKNDIFTINLSIKLTNEN